MHGPWHGGREGEREEKEKKGGKKGGKERQEEEKGWPDRMRKGCVLARTCHEGGCETNCFSSSDSAMVFALVVDSA